MVMPLLVLCQAEGGWLRRVTGAWQAGKVSNLDYLLFCNLAAGRSFNDLTQWPVFPWVLSDYRSARLDLDNPAVFRWASVIQLRVSWGRGLCVQGVGHSSSWLDMRFLHALHAGYEPC